MRKSWIAHAIPNSQDQSLVKTGARVRIGTLSKMSSGHELRPASCDSGSSGSTRKIEAVKMGAGYPASIANCST